MHLDELVGPSRDAGYARIRSTAALGNLLQVALGMMHGGDRACPTEIAFGVPARVEGADRRRAVQAQEEDVGARHCCRRRSSRRPKAADSRARGSRLPQEAPRSTTACRGARDDLHLRRRLVRRGIVLEAVVGADRTTASASSSRCRSRAAGAQRREGPSVNTICATASPCCGRRCVVFNEEHSMSTLHEPDEADVLDALVEMAARVRRKDGTRSPRGAGASADRRPRGRRSPPSAASPSVSGDHQRAVRSAMSPTRMGPTSRSGRAEPKNTISTSPGTPASAKETRIAAAWGEVTAMRAAWPSSTGIHCRSLEAGRGTVPSASRSMPITSRLMCCAVDPPLARRTRASSLSVTGDSVAQARGDTCVASFPTRCRRAAGRAALGASAGSPGTTGSAAIAAATGQRRKIAAAQWRRQAEESIDMEIGGPDFGLGPGSRSSSKREPFRPARDPSAAQQLVDRREHRFDGNGVHAARLARTPRWCACIGAPTSTLRPKSTCSSRHAKVSTLPRRATARRARIARGRTAPRNPDRKA